MNNTCTIAAARYIDLWTKKETHFGDETFCRWEETPERVLHVTMRCASDGYGDDGAGAPYIVEAEALCDDTQSPSGFVV